MFYARDAFVNLFLTLNCARHVVRSGIAVAVLSISCLPEAAFGKTMLRKPETTGVTEDEASALVQLFRGSYAEHSGVDVVLEPVPPVPPTLAPLPSESPASRPVPPPPSPLSPAEAPAPASPISGGAALEAAPALAPAPVPEAFLVAQKREEILAANQESLVEFGRLRAEYETSLFADEYLRLTIIGLNKRIQVRATRLGRDSVLLYSVDTIVAEIDEAPQVMDRLALALFRGAPYANTATINNLTLEETATPVRKNSETIAGIKTGFVFPHAPNKSFDGFVSFGFDARLETNNYFVELGSGFGMPYFDVNSLDSDDTWQSGGLYAELGFNAYLTETETSPYVGLGVSPRLWFSDGGGGMNLLPYGQAGVMFMRSHSTRFYSDFRVGYNVTSLGVTKSGHDVRPFEFGLNLGIGW